MKKLFRLLLFICSIILILNIFVVIFSYNDIDQDDYANKDVILLLGCSVHGTIPSVMLNNRIEKAVEVYEKTHLPVLISGDKSEDKNYDEVTVMKNILLSRNVKEEYIIEDTKGYSTMESIQNLIKEFKYTSPIIVTTKYHEFRAVYIAKKLGLNATGVSAPNVNNKLVRIKNEVREILARPKDFFKTVYVLLTKDYIVTVE